MKILSKDVYKIFRDALASTLKDAGFKRLSCGTLGWTKPVGNRHLIISFECDKYGWSQDFGSMVTFTFELSDAPRSNSGYVNFLNIGLISNLLPDSELELIRKLNNDVTLTLPKPSPTHPVHSYDEISKKWFMIKYKPRLEPYKNNETVWLHYFTVEQIQTWGIFFNERILRMVDTFLKRHNFEI